MGEKIVQPYSKGKCNQCGHVMMRNGELLCGTYCRKCKNVEECIRFVHGQATEEKGTEWNDYNCER